ncbi:AER218Cp [Eremothecium gossypii ATCC 10895]|uniref:allantoinase n=1 Tax=Eremothecium gossypii (strain ATCC 10895 / CBS 109.51 / FGSC 9923 / NRRL Y-1056) TaxID=284811 RepID=Q756N6_EREGS|nr:AER218Cp [Eremothecium gossypii ATCC 10895]AAS52899.1 AER218Cp [Eremothecium gossypii ATCC 10895]AEY97207.1 FAER218Cp [Eremothecium gossypii FDAG1]
MEAMSPAVKAIGSSEVLLDGELKPAVVIFSEETGKIEAIIEGPCEQYLDVCGPEAAKEFRDVTPLVVMPGLVDTHVHLDEPGRVHWEGFQSGTQSAVSGGVTTVVDMPLNSIPPTTTMANFDAKKKAAQGRCWCDVAFWGGLVPGNLEELRPLAEAGVRGFKGFLIDSATPEFQAIDRPTIEAAMATLQGYRTVLLFHAELDEVPALPTPPEDPTLYSSFLETRPDRLEVDALNLIVKCLERATCRLPGPPPPVHIVHMSSKHALPVLERARAAGLPISAETCFHYLTMDAETIPKGSTLHKCCPPIRPHENQAHLWNALRNGVLSSVVSDHSPCEPEIRCCDSGDFLQAWGGISSLGLGLSLIYSKGATLPEIARWCAENTALQAGLGHRKGFIRAGYDADLVLFDPRERHTISNSQLHFRHKMTSFHGTEVVGRVRQTLLRGRVVYDAAKGPSPAPAGTLLLDPII